ncbi:MAG: hypothetical protein COA78_09260 [Blastopirellula sp.]|nr:MAG: hypothetical protein COA78_09260 [Blastopirellula sp.]
MSNRRFNQLRQKSVRKSNVRVSRFEPLEARRMLALEYGELGPNDSLAQAMAIEVSAERTTIHGNIDAAGDLDFFEFTLADDAGVFFDIDARETGLSNLDSIIRVYNSSGTQIDFNNNGYDFDGFKLNNTSSTSDSADSSLYSDLSAGTYRVSVEGSSSSTGLYDFILYSETSYSTTVPVFNSNLGASDTLYLDFNGHSSTNDSWANLKGAYSIAAFGFDNDSTTFSPAEQMAMENIWRVVAEDYSLFNVNVTTVDPGSFNNAEAYHLVIGGSGSDLGYSGGTIGVAYRNSYASGSASDNVGFVFAESFSFYGNESSDQIMAQALEMGNTSSHEFGHALRLRHYGGSNSQPNGIMNTPDFGLNREIWQTGDTHSGESSITFQDDIAVISSSINTFGLRDDDHGDSIGSATVMSGIGGVFQAEGILTSLTDADYFQFTSSGDVSISVLVDEYSANLNAELRVYNSSGQLIATDAPTQSLGASTTLTLAAGDYFIEVVNSGNYGELGQYSVLVEASGDNVVPAGYSVTESSGTTGVSEAGTSDSFDVVLTSQPLTDVVLTISSGNTGEATVNKSTLTFTAANWNVAQTVTVTGVDDVAVDGNQSTVISVRVDDANSDDAFDNLVDQFVNVTTSDNDTAGFIVTESGGTTSVSESGTSDSFDVVLTSQPLTNVVLTISSGDTGEASVNKSTLTFTAANWNVAQTVTVTGVDDNLVDGDQVTTINVSIDDATSDDAFDGLATQAVTVSTSDNDVNNTAGFTITESSGNTAVSETGTSDSFDVVLTSPPVTDVVLIINSGDTGEATVDKSTLIFTAANWNVAQTVTVTGVDDEIVDGSQSSTVTISVDAANSDDAFDSLADQTVYVTTTDDDAPGFLITQTAGTTSVSEAGASDTFNVVLTSKPLTNVVLTVSSSDLGEVTTSITTLTFTAANWNLAQTVTVTGVDDVAVDGNQLSLITVSVNDTSSDNAFDDLADQSVSVTTTDNDTPGFLITESGGTTSVSESGTSDTFSVVLASQPLTDVAFTVSSSDTGEATVNKTTLIFTAANWNVAQTVTVTGMDDVAVDGNQLSLITVSVNDASSDDAFDGLADQSVIVTTTDDDTTGFTVTETGGSTSVSESGTSDTFRVVLTAQPLTDVVLTISSSDTGEVIANVTTLTFTAANWNVAQTVTVTGVDDQEVDGSQLSTITISVNDASSDDAFDTLANQSVSVTTSDDDGTSTRTKTNKNGKVIDLPSKGKKNSNEKTLRNLDAVWAESDEFFSVDERLLDVATDKDESILQLLSDKVSKAKQMAHADNLFAKWD